MAPSKKKKRSRAQIEKTDNGNNHDTTSNSNKSRKKGQQNHVVETIQVMPASAMSYRHNKSGVQFRHAVQILRTYHTTADDIDDNDSHGNGNDNSGDGDTIQIRQSISTGDLVLVADDDHVNITKHFKIAPWKHRPWRVGQVLALVSSLQQQSQTSNDPTTLPVQRNYAIVQWLLPFKYIQEHDKRHAEQPWVDKSELKDIKNEMRPDFMLFQPPFGDDSSNLNDWCQKDNGAVRQSLVDLHCILPGAATLLDWVEFKDKQLPRDLVPNHSGFVGGGMGCFEFYFHCHLRLTSDGSGIPARTKREEFYSTDATTPPATVVAGWQDMARHGVLVDGRHLPASHHAKLVQALTSTYKASNEKVAADRFHLVQQHVPPPPPSPPAPVSNKARALQKTKQPTRKRAAASLTLDKENYDDSTEREPNRKRTKTGKTINCSKAAPGKSTATSKQAKASGAKANRNAQSKQLAVPDDSTHDILSVIRGQTCLTHKTQSKKKTEVLHFCTDVTLVQRERRWTVHVGDVIAVAVEDAASSQPIYCLNKGKKPAATRQQSEWYPFDQPWCPAQVLALYCKDSSVDGAPSGGHANSASAHDTFMQVRWFYRPDELPVEDALPESVPTAWFRPPNGESGRHVVEVDEHVDETTAANILGRIVPTSERDPSAKWLNTFASTHDGVPQLPLICRYIYHSAEDSAADDDGIVGLDESECWTNYAIPSSSPHHPFQRGLSCPKAWPGQLKNLFKAYGGVSMERQAQKQEPKPFKPQPPSPDNASFQSSASSKSSVGSTQAKTSGTAFYTDHSQGIDFFSQLEINPPYDCYSAEMPAGFDASDSVWTVRLGDPVVLECDVGAGRATYVHGARTVMKSSAKSNAYHPFSVPWAVGEVVTIMRRRKDKNVTIEVRWLYREKELSLKSRHSASEQDLLTEEICESDHYDEVSASALLAPIWIHEDVQPITVGRTHLNMPLAEFYCQRYWSVARKSLKPVGRLDGRVERGRLHSNYFGKNAALTKALRPESSSADKLVAVDTGAISYRDAFERVIQKLSLTDASKEANENAGMLVGREKELKQIQSFLKSSIRDDGSGRSDMKASLFIAGPPGTGKTACVRAAVLDLQRKLTAAKRPNFDFITLNGMEMRDPFESYVKLWEQLRGDEPTCSADAAVKKLDSFFCGKGNHHSDKDDRVTVALLDEIDYLETKTQSVLYNFFDWPSRSLECKSRKRLVIIGVSNTLNLPERLHPRVRSRLGSMRIFFKSYSSNETVAILNQKMLQASPNYIVVDQDAIVFAAKKTASLSGDIRKAFAIVRSAAEMVLFNATSTPDAGANPVVCTNDVVKVCRDSTNSAQSRSVGMCADFEVLLLVTLASLSKTTGREYGGFDVEEIVTKMESIANSHGDNLYLPPPSLSETLGIVSQLRQSHLITVQSPQYTSLNHRASLSGCGGPWPLVSMVLDDIAIHQALRDTPHAALTNKFLSRSYR